MKYENTRMMSKVFGFTAAVVMAAAVNGSLLWGFDDVAHRAVAAPDLMASLDAQALQRQVTLPAVTIHAHKA